MGSRKIEVTPSERLKEIEARHKASDFNMTQNIADTEWLINRVKRLSEALEYYANQCPERCTDQNPMEEWSPTIPYEMTEIARKALESDE